MSYRSTAHLAVLRAPVHRQASSFAAIAAQTVPRQDNSGNSVPVFHFLSSSIAVDRKPYWQVIPKWQNISTDQFLNHKWQMSNTVQSEKALYEFLIKVLPETIPAQTDMAPHLRTTGIETPMDFIDRLKGGIKRAPMAVRLSPHILSSINWKDPINDPIRRQFIPLSSPLNIDHPKAELDPMKERIYSPVPGLIHRYPDRALFFGQ
ncbi:L-lysine 2-3-aminomutase [Penicillium herquei]|nr:L-lysine 2-3-aminomutase [Penicillium herquei]